MADDGKRSQTVSVKVTDRMRLDIANLAATKGKTESDYIYGYLRLLLYGEVTRIEQLAAKVMSGDNVDREDGKAP